jgi:hypothetical protein
MSKPPKDDTPAEPAVDTRPEQARIAVSRELRKQHVPDAEATPQSAGLLALEALIASWLQGTKSDEPADQ